MHPKTENTNTYRLVKEKNSGEIVKTGNTEFTIIPLDHEDSSPVKKKTMWVSTQKMVSHYNVFAFKWVCDCEFDAVQQAGLFVQRVSEAINENCKSTVYNI